MSKKELLKSNETSILTPYELLQINQFNTLGKLEKDTVLDRLGLNDNIKVGKKISEKRVFHISQIEKFDKKRVFHISQIEKICNKYWLKFLPITYFKGEIDTDLSQKVVKFELIYNEYVTQNSSYIVAPIDSFNLQDNPKDPLFFHKINEEYYYLIHKWGNDLNIFNRIKSLILTFPEIFNVIFFATLFMLYLKFCEDLQLMLSLCFVSFVIGLFSTIVIRIEKDNFNYDSHFKN
jgi:hypothetical protein